MERSTHPVDVGQRSETAILAAFVERRFLAWLPWGVNNRADMLLDFGDRILRVQCKTARLRNGAVSFSACSIRSNTKRAFRRSYIGEIAYFAAYCPENRRVYMVPCVAGTPQQVTLRVDPTINRQGKGVRWAADYALERFSP